MLSLVRSQEWYKKSVPYVAPPVAGAIGIVPAFYFLMWKSSLQTGSEKPTFRVAFREGIGASRLTGGIIASQMLLQGAVEKGMVKEGEKPSFTQMTASSVGVAVLTSPLLFALNAKTMKSNVPKRPSALNVKTIMMTFWKSIRHADPKQVGAIALREGPFVASNRLSRPVQENMEKSFGKSWAVRRSSDFVTGMVGSIFGNPGDAILTRLQNGLPISPRHMMLGWLPRAIGLGIFNTTYQGVKETF